MGEMEARGNTKLQPWAVFALENTRDFTRASTSSSAHTAEYCTTSRPGSTACRSVRGRNLSRTPLCHSFDRSVLCPFYLGMLELQHIVCIKDGRLAGKSQALKHQNG